MTFGVYSLLYHFIFFIALLQIYSYFVINFNFLVHKKIYFAFFYCIFQRTLHIFAFSSFLTAYFMAYFGSFYCIKILSLLISHQNLSGTYNYSSTMQFRMLVEFWTQMKQKFQKLKLSLFQSLKRMKIVGQIFNTGAVILKN